MTTCSPSFNVNVPPSTIVPVRTGSAAHRSRTPHRRSYQRRHRRAVIAKEQRKGELLVGVLGPIAPVDILVHLDDAGNGMGHTAVVAERYGHRARPAPARADGVLGGFGGVLTLLGCKCRGTISMRCASLDQNTTGIGIGLRVFSGELAALNLNKLVLPIGLAVDDITVHPVVGRILVNLPDQVRNSALIILEIVVRKNRRVLSEVIEAVLGGRFKHGSGLAVGLISIIIGVELTWQSVWPLFSSMYAPSASSGSQAC